VDQSRGSKMFTVETNFNGVTSRPAMPTL
jgi:hypothetical protein